MILVDRSAEACHIVDTQYTDGIEGALIVHPRSYPHGFPTWDEDLVVELADLYHLFSTNISSQYLSVCSPLCESSSVALTRGRAT